MPTYQYACTECGEQLEVAQKFSDDPLTVCPACQGRLRKLYSSVGVVFKGSGFYRTDSRAAANGKPDGGKTTERSADSTPSGTTESKTEKAATGSAGTASASTPASSSSAASAKAAAS